MEQYFIDQREKYFSLLAQSSDQLPLPIAFADHHLHQFWENRCLQKNYPFLTGRENILQLLAGHNINDVILTLSSQDGCMSLASSIPMTQIFLTLSPVYDEKHIFLGVVVHFSVNSTRSFQQDESMPQKMLRKFDVSMKDPINSLVSGIDTMARRLEVDDTAGCETLLQNFSQSCYHLLKSCNLISEYSNYTNGLSTLNLTVVHLNSYLDDLLHTFQMLAKKNHIVLEYTLPEEEIDMALDLDKLVILLSCLLSNSFAFLEDPAVREGHVKIQVSVSKHQIQFTVSDNGIGIDPQILPHVFEPYFTCKRNDFQYSHLGLGLPLCQMIVLHHRGQIYILPQKGEGTTVVFTLSRQLEQNPEQLIFCDTPLDYIKNPYSDIYVYLSDVFPKGYV